MKKLAALSISLVLLLSGCQFIESTAATTDIPISEIKPTIANTQAVSLPHFGATLNISMRSPKTLNPLLNEDDTVDIVLKLLFEQLCAVDASQKPILNLAASVVFAEDGLSAIVNLRKDVYWSDGTEMTAQDMAYSFNTIKSTDGSSIYKQTTRDITECLPIDNYSVKVNYSAVQEGMGYSLCFPIIPKNYYSGENDPASIKNMAPMGNGPYNFVSLSIAKDMQLTASNTTFRQKPYIQKISVLITNDVQTDMQAFDQGLIDLLSYDMVGFSKYSGSKDMNISEYSTNYYDFIGFNFKNIVFDDKKVREAVASCINADELIERVYLGHAVKATSVVNPSSWAYEPEVKTYTYDMEQAKNLIYQAGFKDNDLDGILDREVAGVTFELNFSILVNEENTERIKIAEILASNLADLGISVNIDICDFETYKEKLKSGDFDIFIGAYNFSVKPNFMFAFHSTKIDIGENYFAYRSESLDSCLVAADLATNEAAYKKALSDIQKHIAEELPCVSLVFRDKVVLSDTAVVGDKNPVLNNIFADISSWYIE